MNVWDLLVNSKDSKEEEDEEDIKRTCEWLKEAGFPQYVQMFKDGEFPISLKLVQEDHFDFDGGTLMALFRRIEILNKSAEGKSEIRIEEYSSTIKESVTITHKPRYEIIEDESSGEDEEDEDGDDDDKENVSEQTALSSNWSFEHRTRRWSHIESTNSQVNLSTDNSTILHNYLGISLPKPYISQVKEKQKRPTNLSAEFHQQFEPILENNSEVNDCDLQTSNTSMELTPSSTDNHSRWTTSLSGESRDSGDCLSPSSPDNSYIISNHSNKEKSNHILRSTSLKLMKAVSRLNPHQLSFRNQKGGKHSQNKSKKTPDNSNHLEDVKARNLDVSNHQKYLQLKEDLSLHNLNILDKSNKLFNEFYHIGDLGCINTRTGSFISRSGHRHDDDGKKSNASVLSDLDPIISLLESDVDSLDQMRSKIRSKPSSGSAPNSPILRKKSEAKPNVDRSSQRLSDIETYTRTKSRSRVNSNDLNPSFNRIYSPPMINKSPDYNSSKELSPSPKILRNSATRWSHTIYPNSKDKSPKLYKLVEFSVTQVNILKKLSVLGCTSMLEKHCPSQKNVFNWRLPRLLSQKQKITLEESKFVFGVNLYICQIRYGQPFPPAILNIFQYLREQGPSAQGIFRKAGMKSRSKILKKEIEINPNFNCFDEYGVFDVADVLKVFFRDLPDRLLTSKLSATLVAIYSYVPKEHQLEGLQLALLSLPDENRTALEILIEFLSFLASHSEITKMDAKNLSLIFAPNLFNFPTDTSPNSSMSPLRNKRSNGPNVKHLAEQNAAQVCIMDMMTNAHLLFQLSEIVMNKTVMVTDETLKKNHNKMNNAEPKDICQLISTGLWQDWLCEKINQLKADTVNHKSGWTNISKDFIRKLHGSNSLVEQLSYRKIGSRDNNADGIALRTWKVVIDIDVSPGYLFTNIKDKRHIWDPSVTTAEILQEMNDYVDLVQLTSCNADGSSVPRCFNLLRGHQLGMNGSIHVIVAESVNIQHLMTLSNSANISEHPSLYSDQSAVTGQVFCDNFMIEASSSKTSRVTWISRVDLRGHHSDWYSCHWGHDLVKRATSLKTFSESNLLEQQSPAISSNSSTYEVVFCPKINEPNENINEEVLNASRETDL